MLILKTKWLARFARQENISDASLREAVERAARGLIDADLGGGIIKQRIGRKGRGRSGGYRMIVAYQAESRAVFLYGFAKSERENIGSQELADLRELGSNWLNATAHVIANALADGALQEVHEDEREEEQAE